MMWKSTSAIALVSAVFLVDAICVTATPPTTNVSPVTTKPSSDEKDAIAYQAVEQSRPIALAVKKNFEDSRGPSGIESLTLGDALPQTEIRLDQLRLPGAGPSLLENAINSKQTPTITWPFKRGDRIVAGVNVFSSHEGWRVGDTPNTADLRQAESTMREIHQSHPHASSLQTIKVSALHLWLIAFKEDEMTLLVPIRDYPSMNFVQGRALSAAEIMPKITAAAERYNDLPN